MAIATNDFTLDQWQMDIVQRSKTCKYLVGTAPAGAGKTATVVEIVRSAVADGIDAGKIYCVSYTDASKTVLKDRLAGVIPDRNISTGHGFAFRLCQFHWKLRRQPALRVYDHRRHGYNKPELILRDIIAEEFDVFDLDMLPKPSQVDGWFGAFKATGLAQGAAAAWFKAMLPWDVAKAMTTTFERYEKALNEKGLITFDNMLWYAFRYLVEDQETRSRLQRQVGHMIIDEAQAMSWQALRILGTAAMDEGDDRFLVTADDIHGNHHEGIEF